MSGNDIMWKQQMRYAHPPGSDRVGDGVIEYALEHSYPHGSLHHRRDE